MAEEIPLPPPSPPPLLPPPAHLVLVECFGFRRALAKDAAAAAAVETQTLLSNGPNFLFLSSRPQFSLSAEETTWPPFHFSLSLSLSLSSPLSFLPPREEETFRDRERQTVPSFISSISRIAAERERGRARSPPSCYIEEPILSYFSRAARTNSAVILDLLPPLPSSAGMQ